MPCLKSPSHISGVKNAVTLTFPTSLRLEYGQRLKSDQFWEEFTSLAKDANTWQTTAAVGTLHLMFTGRRRRSRARGLAALVCGGQQGPVPPGLGEKTHSVQLEAESKRKGNGGSLLVPTWNHSDGAHGLNLRFFLGPTCENWGIHCVCHLGQLFSPSVGIQNQTRLCLEAQSGVGTLGYPSPFIPQPSSLPRAQGAV